MRTLVVGAGALGGYIGASLQRAGRDVGFLVRPNRAAQLATDGLRVNTAEGRFTVQPHLVSAATLTAPYDVVLLAVKAYGLASTMDDISGAVGPDTVIVPVLNGMRHIAALADRFGAEQVFGGATTIGASLDASGEVTQAATPSQLILGEPAGGVSPRSLAIAELFTVPGITARASEAVMQEMWEKFALLAAYGGFTCLLRARIGEILAVPGGGALMADAFAETCTVAAASGFAPAQAFRNWVLGVFHTPGSRLRSSMSLDIERGAPTEGEHILGDMQARARRHGIATSLLDIACIHLRAYEATRC